MPSRRWSRCISVWGEERGLLLLRRHSLTQNDDDLALALSLCTPCDHSLPCWSMSMTIHCRELPQLLYSVSNDDAQSAINVALSLDETYADIAPVRTSANQVSAFVYGAMRIRLLWRCLLCCFVVVC